ncbi:TPM domain-containing protein [Novosphingobium gossypii]|uniref:TPM domain-containing protein n=1 Tax=Novosphingobium gossypii TaxID=1604774 RepID=UPI003D261479
MSILLRTALASALLLAGCNMEPSAEQTSAASSAAVIPRAGLVTDAANIIPPRDMEAITAKLAALERATKHQVVVVTTPSLDGEDIATFTIRLAKAWGVGRAGHNDGVVLLVAPRERQLRITVGYGLEDTLTNEVCRRIIQQQMVPRFKAGDLPRGIADGVDAIVLHLMTEAMPRAG